MNEQIIPASSPVTQPAPKSASEIAEQILGHIDWMTQTEGYCDCPGQNRHSSKSGRRDCAVYLDQIPTVHCVHASCNSVLASTNRRLRDAILNGEQAGHPRKITPEDKARRKERENSERLRLRAAKALPQLLKAYAWPYQQIIADSPVDLTGNEPEHWKLLLQHFDPEDLVWIGDKYDSGKPEHAAHFKTTKDWLNKSVAPAPFICPAAFKNTSFARSNDNIVARRFLVVESDTLTRDQVGAVFRWLTECDLKLVAIVDTAGKSLHGWFEFEEDLVDDLKLVLPAFQCDPKLFTASQPVRLPGALRDGVAGKYQKLVYLSEGVAHV